MLIGAVLGTACGGGTPAPDDGPGEYARPAGWPADLLVGPGAGPALYLSEAPDSPAIGYVSEDVVVRLVSGPVGDRIRVQIRGGLRVRGWLNLSRLAAKAQHRGKISGTPIYLGPGNVVGVRGSGSDGNVRVEASPNFGRAAATTVGPFVGEFPLSAIASGDPTDDADAPSDGAPHLLPTGAAVPVYDRPGGEIVATLPALDPPLTVVVLRDRNGWKGIRAGVGPYLVGYVDATLTPTDAGPEAPALQTPAPSAVPARLQTEGDRPLLRVPSGARVRFDGETIGIFGAEGWAREMNRYETGEVDVFVAVDDEVALRGMMRGQDLREGEAPTETPAAPTEAPSEAEPDPAAATPPPADDSDAPIPIGAPAGPVNEDPTGYYGQ